MKNQIKVKLSVTLIFFFLLGSVFLNEVCAQLAPPMTHSIVFKRKKDPGLHNKEGLIKIGPRGNTVELTFPDSDLPSIYPILNVEIVSQEPYIILVLCEVLSLNYSDRYVTGVGDIADGQFSFVGPN